MKKPELEDYLRFGGDVPLPEGLLVEEDYVLIADLLEAADEEGGYEGYVSRISLVIQVLRLAADLRSWRKKLRD